MAGASRNIEIPNEGVEDVDERGKTMGAMIREHNGDIITSRVDRFVDVGPDSDVFKSKSLNSKKAFYNGTEMDERMAEIRKSIDYIRQNWVDYNKFMAALTDLLMGLNFEDDIAKENVERLLSMQRDWLTKDEALNSKRPNYEAITLYTSQEGQRKMYKVGNDIFREEDSIAVVEKIRCVVFLVELINIDLFNLCLVRPEKRNFEGITYRGLGLHDEELEAFNTLREEPISRRNIAIPLGLLSASSSVAVAEKFIRIQLDKHKDENLKPFIIKTHVIGLKPEYVDYYNKTFPSTLLTTICAVDIHDISLYPKEKEVLLRGPFFLILDLYTDKYDVPGGECYVLETVMLNANRDHISTSLLGDRAAAARDLFSTMVTITRSEFAIKYCESKGFDEDAEEYRQILKENHIRLNGLMKS